MTVTTMCSTIVQWRFKCLPEDRAKADQVLELKFRNIVPKMLSEEKQSAFKKLYKDDNVPPEDVDEKGNRWPTKEALISVKPKDFTTDEGWSLLCEHWSTPEFRRMSLRAKHCRQSGGNQTHHRSGSRSLPATRQFLVISAHGKHSRTFIYRLAVHSIQYNGVILVKCRHSKPVLTLDLVVLGWTTTD